ncbi:hypothetical protein TRVL_08639 [Trypanosoma vivax]|nr:hypothetical protein TRVL_08639 [Trypanosoma vivax]
MAMERLALITECEVAKQRARLDGKRIEFAETNRHLKGLAFRAKEAAERITHNTNAQGQQAAELVASIAQTLGRIGSADEKLQVPVLSSRLKQAEPMTPLIRADGRGSIGQTYSRTQSQIGSSDYALRVTLGTLKTTNFSLASACDEASIMTHLKKQIGRRTDADEGALKTVALLAKVASDNTKRALLPQTEAQELFRTVTELNKTITASIGEAERQTAAVEKILQGLQRKAFVQTLRNTLQTLCARYKELTSLATDAETLDARAAEMAHGVEDLYLKMPESGEKHGNTTEPAEELRSVLASASGRIELMRKHACAVNKMLTGALGTLQHQHRRTTGAQNIALTHLEKEVWAIVGNIASQQTHSMKSNVCKKGQGQEYIEDILRIAAARLESPKLTVKISALVDEMTRSLEMARVFMRKAHDATALAEQAVDNAKALANREPCPPLYQQLLEMLR